MVKNIAAAIGVVVAVAALIYGLSWGGYAIYAQFQPKYTATQYKTFKESQQYNEGMAQQLAAYQTEYLGAKTSAQRDAIRSIVREQFAAYDPAKLSPSLRDFLEQMNQ